MIFLVVGSLGAPQQRHSSRDVRKVAVEDGHHATDVCQAEHSRQEVLLAEETKAKVAREADAPDCGLPGHWAGDPACKKKTAMMLSSLPRFPALEEDEH